MGNITITERSTVTAKAKDERQKKLFFAGCLVLSLWLIYVLIASLWPTHADNLVGTYRALYPSGEEILILRKDGTFQQTFVPKSGNRVKNFGYWRFHEQQHQVAFKDHLWIMDGSQKPDAHRIIRGYSSLTVSSNFGRVMYITINEDTGLFYKKMQ